jgi:hypothetical protein
MEKIVVFTPAYDKRAENCGIAAVEIYFVLKGTKGAVHFSVMTNWFLPHNMKELKTNQYFTLKFEDPMGMSVGYHSLKPMFNGQTRKYCSWLKKKAYCDSSALRAEHWVETYLLPGGSDEIWKQLGKEYKIRFEGELDG